MKKIELNNLLKNDDLIKDIDKSLNVDIFKDAFNTDGLFLSNIDTKKPLVSFIIPTHNRYIMLKQTLKSISIQNNCNYEIIIINDNSNEKEYDNLLNDYTNLPITCINNEISKGPGIARQLGYLKSQGKYIVFADDDDFYINDNFLEKGINKLEENNNLAFISYNTITFYEENNTVLANKINSKGLINGKDYFLNFISKYQKPTSTFPTIYRKEMLDKANFKDMEMMNDASIYLRSLTQGDAFIFDDYIGVYRVHTSNISKAIPHQFILDNIKEKNNIYNLASNKFDINLKNWLLNQILDTFRYYVVDSKCKFDKAKDFINTTSKITSISKLTLYYNYLKFLVLKKIVNK